MADKSDYIRDEAEIITDDAERLVSGLQFLQNKRTVECLNYPTAERLYGALNAINKLMPVALENTTWRKETSIRQSFSKVRSDAIDEAEHTVVGRKKDGKKRRSVARV